MIKRITGSPSGREPSPPGLGEGQVDQREKSLLTARAAGILGASLIVSLSTAGLTYLAVGGLAPGEIPAATASAAIAAVAAFAGSVRFLNSVVE
jgi:hypothetical protein